MALIKGICKNFGECDLADNKEIQEVDKTNFVCEECGKPLHPVNGSGGRGRKTPGGRSNMKLVCIIAASMIGLAGACIGIYSHLSKSKIDRLIVEKKVVTLHVGQNEIIKASAVDKDGKEIKDANVIYLWTIADKKVAFVRCQGSCDKAKQAYKYTGIADCSDLAVVPNASEKECPYSCCGYGSCVKACKFDAIHIVNGVAVVDKEKCVACGACIKACPKHIIDFVPYKKKHIVACQSHLKGKTSRS